MLTASGSNMENPPASYYKILRDPARRWKTPRSSSWACASTATSATIIRSSDGRRTSIIRWPHFSPRSAAGRSQVQGPEDRRHRRRRRHAARRDHRGSKRRRSEAHPHRPGRAADFPLSAPGPGSAHGQRREQLAHWIASKDNPYFASSYVNRLWSYLLGVGIIEPVDDIRAGNPPTNPALLDALTDDFVQSGFNVQQMIKTICKSRVYQQSVRPTLRTATTTSTTRTPWFAACRRRCCTTPSIAPAARDSTAGIAAGARAAQMLDSRDDVPGGFFVQFGKPARESACECERSADHDARLGPQSGQRPRPGRRHPRSDQSPRQAGRHAKRTMPR